MKVKKKIILNLEIDASEAAQMRKELKTSENQLIRLRMLAEQKPDTIVGQAINEDFLNSAMPEYYISMFIKVLDANRADF